MHKPIFIHGILQRSGTNLLNRILLLHEACYQPSVRIRENWFLHFSDGLWQDLDQMDQAWRNPDWKGGDFDAARLKRLLGDSLTRFLEDPASQDRDLHLISKTPSVRRIERFPDLFPDARLLIIVRDPRDVAASAFNSWQAPIGETVTAWRRSANTIVAFEERYPDFPHLLLRYEDLVTRARETTTKCLGFLDLSASEFPWDSLVNLPVFGSSESGKWEVVSASDSFQPIGRWKSLPESERRELLATHIPELAYFGYGATAESSMAEMPAAGRRKELAGRLRTTPPGPDSRNGNWRAQEIRSGLSSLARACFGKRR